MANDPKSVQITLDEYEARLVVEDRSGIKTSKVVNPDDIAAALVQNAKLSTGILPRNTKLYMRNGDYTTIMIEDQPRRKQKVIYRPDGQRTGQNFFITTPRMLFAFVLTLNTTSGRGSGDQYLMARSHAYALKNPLMSLQDQLYRCPFANIHNQGNAICWGNNYVSSFDNLIYLERVIDIFWDAEFNNHLDNGRNYTSIEVNISGQKMHINRTPDLFKHLDGKDESFPENILIGLGDFKSVTDMELRI